MISIPKDPEDKRKTEFVGDNALEKAIRDMSGESSRISYKEIKKHLQKLYDELEKKLSTARIDFEAKHTEDVRKAKDTVQEIANLDSDVHVLCVIESKKCRQIMQDMSTISHKIGKLDPKVTYEADLITKINEAIQKLKEEK